MQIKECDLFSILADDNQNISLISAISFESRSLAASQIFVNANIPPKIHFIFDYMTIAEPFDEDMFIRDQQRKHFMNCFDNNCETIFINKFSATSLSPFVKKMEEIFNLCSNTTLYIDITCLTSVHLIGIATAIFNNSHDYSKIHFLYSTPLTYSFGKGIRFTCRDVIHIPIGRQRQLTREGHAIGLILPGHDPERLTVALEEIEPINGVIIYSNTQTRPDFLCSSLELNKYVTDRLRYREEIVDLFDAVTLSECVEYAVNTARESEAPLILYPFGPKVHVLVASLKMAQANDVDTWAIYPVPTCFHVRATDGVGKTTCFSVEKRN